MPNINETQEMARKVLPIFYVLDTSGSMQGQKIASVNEAMHETVEVLKDVSNKNPDAIIKIAVLTFSSGTQWATNEKGLEDLEDFFWNDITAGGTTDLGYAIEELNSKLSRSQFLVSDTGFCIPVIIFLSDGRPTDSWKNKLKKAKENKRFKNSTKIGIAVGDDADRETLATVVDNIEAVISVNDIDTLKRLIKVASLTSSMVNSKSRTTADNDNAAEIVKQVQQDMADEGDKIKVESNKDKSITENQIDSNKDTLKDDWD